MLDLGFSRAQLLQLGEFVVGRLRVEIGVDHPFIGPGLIRFIGDDDGRRRAREEKVGFGDRLALCARTGDGDAVAYFACSFASRSSNALRPRSA